MTSTAFAAPATLTSIDGRLAFICSVSSAADTEQLDALRAEYRDLIALRRTIAAPVAAQPAPVAVPAGRYAIGTGDALRFYIVSRPTEGKWAGYVFLAVQASDEEHPIRNRSEKARILAALGADLEGAMRLYGQMIGACGHCNRTLTNPESIAYGIGPICREKMGF